MNEQRGMMQSGGANGATVNGNSSFAILNSLFAIPLVSLSSRDGATRRPGAQS